MPMTVANMFKKTMEKNSDRVAIKFKKNGQWLSMTWAEHWNEVRKIAKGLMALDLKPKEATTIIGANCYEWVCADLASILAGGVPAGIYPTSSSEQAEYICQHSKASIVVVEDNKQLDKILAVIDSLKNLKAIVMMKGVSDHKKVYSWKDVLKKGKSVTDSELEERIAQQKSEDLATLVYTSGTTSNPKAVMLSHENITWTAENVLSNHLDLTNNDLVLSYLPLSHIAEQMISIHAPLAVGYQVHFAESIEKLAENLKEVRPTVFLGVPRVWEKIQSKMIEKGAKSSPLKKTIATWAKKVGLEQAHRGEYKADKTLKYMLADKIVFSKVREALGLDRCRFQITAAAPISKETLNFFFSLGIPIFEIYGMSECTGPATISLPNGRYRIGKAGSAIFGTNLKIASDGEILVKGKHVCLGYLDNKEETQKLIDKDGWLHTGDLGYLDADNFLVINGRKKNLIITAGGENISTEMIENKYNAIPGVEHVVAIGDQRKYLSLLFTLDQEAALSQSKKIGSPAKSIDEVAKCSKFHDYLNDEVKRINASTARVQSIKRFKVLSNAFSEDSGELTPTMKVKRSYVLDKFKNEIGSMYN